MVYHTLRRLGEQAVPAETMAVLRDSYLRTASQNLYIRSRLETALRIVTGRGIPVMALKGATLLEEVYGNPGLRPMSDVDLMVPEERAGEAYTLLRDLGYRPIGTAEEQEATHRNHRHLPTLVSEDGIVVLEVHSHIVTKDSPFRFDIGAFWDHAREATVAGVCVKAPRPEHMLLHLAVHFFLDRRFRSFAALSQVADIAAAIDAYGDEIDWDFLQREAVSYGLGMTLFSGLTLARDLMDAPVPHAVLASLGPARADRRAVELLVRRRVLNTERGVITSILKPNAKHNAQASPAEAVAGAEPRITATPSRHRAPRPVARR